MIRKQIYLEEHQQENIRSRAAAKGVSEAEVIRQAIDSMVMSRPQGLSLDSKAWNRALKFMKSLQRKRRGATSGVRKWKREDLYAERLSRYDRGSR